MEAERWADVADRWRQGDAPPGDTAYAQAYAAILRALICRSGIEQAVADADEAVQRCAGQGIVTPAPRFTRGSHVSFPATSRVATDLSRMPSVPGSRLARTRL